MNARMQEALARTQAALDLLNSWAQASEEEVAEQRETWAELRAGLNQSRRQSGARLLFAEEEDAQALGEPTMTLTLELPSELEQVLEARAQARGVSLPKYLLDLAERDAAQPERPAPEPTAPAPGSLEDAAAHLARVQALMAAPAAEREAVIVEEANALQAFYDSPEGRTEWEESQAWLNAPGPDIDALEEEDARESERMEAQARGAA